MEESEEKPPEGCNNDPKPVTPQPGAAQLWLGGLKTMEEGENKMNKGNKMKLAGTAKGIDGVLQTWRS